MYVFVKRLLELWRIDLGKKTHNPARRFLSSISYPAIQKSAPYPENCLHILPAMPKLAAQPDNVHIDAAVGDRVVVAANSVDDLGAAEAPTGSGRRKRKYLEWEYDNKSGLF